eukprot:403348372
MLKKILFGLTYIHLSVASFLNVEAGGYSALYSTRNPFDENTHEMFVNPWFQKEVEASKTLTDTQKQRLKDMPAAYWVDTQSAIQTRTPSLNSLLQEASHYAKQTSKKVTVMFIHYNLPNRDCSASASNGEICCSGNPPNPNTGSCDDSSYTSGDCSKGLNKYHSYTDEVYQVVSKYPELEIVALIEPDSLPNLATNLGKLPHCTETTKQSYVNGVGYAIKKLSQISNLQLYIDVGHGGWLGWCGNHPCKESSECGSNNKCMRGYCECPADRLDQNSQTFVSTIKDIFNLAGQDAVLKIRGFATNTANYQPLGYPDDTDHCMLGSQWNFAYNELRYIDQMDALFKKNGISKNWITDTGRNGVPEMRSSAQQCQNWCNVKGGLGLRPTSQVQELQKLLQSASLDAVVWSKTPGESDGCSPGSGQQCTRVDQMCQRDCQSEFQKCPAPEAGQWDDDMIKYLSDHAQPQL